MINYSFVRVVCAPLLHNESQWRLTKNAEQRVDSRKRLAKAKRFTVASIRRVCPSTSPFLSLSAAECSMSYSDNQHIKVFRIAVLVSGSGRSLQNLCERIHADHLHGCEISLVIASKPSAGALQRAENFGVPTRVIKQKDFNGNIDAFSEAISHVLDEFRVDLVIMAGWMHFYQIPARYDGRVINIHPSLIPSFCGKGFYGNRVHEAVIKFGAKISGCTVHLADNKYDHGPIILQKPVPVFDTDDTNELASRVFEKEKEALPEAIQLFVDGRLSVENGIVRIARG